MNPTRLFRSLFIIASCAVSYSCTSNQHAPSKKHDHNPKKPAASAENSPRLGRSDDVGNPYLSVPAPIQRMFHPERFPDIYILTHPHNLFTKRADLNRIRTGHAPTDLASHGTLWAHDADVPIVFFGKGIRRGYVGDTAHLVDIAPTLAYLAGIQRPSASVGRVLHDILEPEVARWRMSERPRVLVMVSLDQARRDYVGVFGDALRFFRNKIIADGSTFANSTLLHAKAATSVSHTTVGTGTIPAIHGVINNQIPVKNSGFVPAFDDGCYKQRGHGSLNPEYNLVPTLADELDQRFDNLAVVIGASIKARAVLGVLGHGAYYQAPSPSRLGADKDTLFSCNAFSGVPYTNEQYYELPEYLRVETSPKIGIASWLKTNYGIDLERSSWTEKTRLIDRGPYAASSTPIGPETPKFPWGKPFNFSRPWIDQTAAKPTPLQRPTDFDENARLTSRYETTMFTPAADLWCADLVLRTMAHKKVGRDEIPDIVFFHAKSFDVVGHRYGIASGEIYSYLFFADYMLKKIVHWLDTNVGPNQYVLAIFGDHGATNVSDSGQWLADDALGNAINKEFGPNLFRRQMSDQIWLDRKLLRARGYTTDDVARFVERHFPWIMRAYSYESVATATRSHPDARSH